MAAVDDMEALYASTQCSGRLADEKFDFMKEELKVKDVLDVVTKARSGRGRRRPCVLLR